MRRHRTKIQRWKELLKELKQTNKYTTKTDIMRICRLDSVEAHLILTDMMRLKLIKRERKNNTCLYKITDDGKLMIEMLDMGCEGMLKLYKKTKEAGIVVK